MESLTWEGLFVNLVYSSSWAVVVFIAGFGSAWATYRLWGRLIPVDIRTRKVRGAESGVTPKILVATFSGYRKPDGLAPEDYEEALRKADLDKLPVHEGVGGIGHTVRSLLTYGESLDEVYLITSFQSHAAVELLKRFARDSGIGATIHARPSENLRLDDDAEVTERAHEVTRDLLIELRRRAKPRSILVDVTGGTRSMTIGALLACLIPDQDVQVIAAQYKPNGQVEGDTSYPLVIKFAPNLRALYRLS